MFRVITTSERQPAAAELFQLFKTPWTASDDSDAPILLVGEGTDIPKPTKACRLLIIASSRPTTWDEVIGTSVRHRLESGYVQQPETGRTLRLYKGVAMLDVPLAGVPLLISRTGTAGFALRRGDRWEVRLGFDPVQETEFLLSHTGQPAEHAREPTLENHIALLRTLGLGAGVELIEVASRPPGTPYIACLTHDVDFWGLRRHRLDATAAGFVSRAVLETPYQALLGRRKWAQVAHNLRAAAAYPLIQLGAARDFWQPIQSYRQAEDDLRSTFFVVPRKKYAGISPDGQRRRRRAVAYEAADVADDLRKAAKMGCEVELHGLDAWHDSEASQREKRDVEKAVDQPCHGVRMHWLFFNQDSWRHLEAAGFDYDSSIGYNSAIGYRAGTGQAYRPLGTSRLLELPLAIQDTALFYANRMGLTEAQAWEECASLLQRARQVGGSVVINWHGRSLLPERLWGEFYQRLLERFRDDGAWIASAGQTVDWFAARREVGFQSRPSGIAVLPQKVTGPLSLTRSRARGPVEHLLMPEIDITESTLTCVEACA